MSILKLFKHFWKNTIRTVALVQLSFLLCELTLYKITDLKVDAVQQLNKKGRKRSVSKNLLSDTEVDTAKKVKFRRSQAAAIKKNVKKDMNEFINKNLLVSIFIYSSLKFTIRKLISQKI